MTFCSLFNKGKYAAEGWVCHYTIRKHIPDAKFYVFCMDDETLKQAQRLRLKGVIPISLQELEQKYPQVKAVKSSRAFKEYIVTYKPFLPEYIFDRFGENKLVFADSDIAFWGNPNEIFDEMGECSFLVKDHGFEPPRSAGRFNVGLLAYKNDRNCREWLKWWQDCCVEWCKWRAENGKFAEQGYLNILHDQPQKFKGVAIPAHPGINLAPWNIMKHQISKENGKLLVDGKTLICYHYHEFEIAGDTYHPTGWTLPSNARPLLYDPYFRLVKKSYANKLWEGE